MKPIHIEECDINEILTIAEEIKNKSGRLMGIFGYINDDGNNVIVYCFEINNIDYSFRVIGEDEIPSIREFFLNATLYEDELQEIMPISLVALEKKNRVFLPEEFEIGCGQILIMSLEELTKLKNN